MRRRLLPMFAVVLIWTAGCQAKRPDRDQCLDLLDHYLALATQEAAPPDELTEPMKASVAKRKEELRRDMGTEFVKDCVSKVSIEEWRCARASSTTVTLERCHKP